MFRILKPPTQIALSEQEVSIFLAGSIEMGQAVPWQSEFERSFTDLDVTLLNPRRDEWDRSWEQSISNTQFREQVEWELSAQEQASCIAMYFAPETKAPITLLEFGLFAKSGKLIVCCPPDFWRSGNIQVVCGRYDIHLVPDLTSLMIATRERVNTLRAIARDSAGRR